MTWWPDVLCVLTVGLSRYSSHSAPVCDRKDFVLNLNGISSLHPSTGGAYYHQLHHHHQSVYQDVKPCVMWQNTKDRPALTFSVHFNSQVELFQHSFWWLLGGNYNPSWSMWKQRQFYSVNFDLFLPFSSLMIMVWRLSTLFTWLTFHTWAGNIIIHAAKIPTSVTAACEIVRRFKI